MDYERYLIGTVIGINADDYTVECDDLEQFGYRGGEVRFSSAKDTDKYKDLDLKDGVRVRLGINNNDGNYSVDILERLEAYERKTLDRYLDVLLKHNQVNHMVPEIMAESDQIPVSFGDSEEISTDDIKNFVKDDEVFTDNPNYQKEAKDFNVYDSRGNVMFSIKSEDNMSGKINQISFTFPFDNNESREAFLDFCDRLQKIKAVKYPQSE